MLKDCDVELELPLCSKIIIIVINFDFQEQDEELAHVPAVCSMLQSIRQSFTEDRRGICKFRDIGYEHHNHNKPVSFQSKCQLRKN